MGVTERFYHSLNVTSAAILETTWDGKLSENYRKEWLAALISSCILLTAGIYLFVSLTLYEYKVFTKNRKVGGINRARSVVVKDKTADWMRWLCLTASLLFLARLVFEFVEIFEGQRSRSVCDVSRYSKAVFMCGAVICIYLVLWLRQRKFYNLPALKHLSNKPIQFFSASVIVLMTTAAIVTISLYLFTRFYKNSARGCILGGSTVWTKLPGLLLFLFTISFQIILLGLLIYPLYKHRTSAALVGQTAELKVMKRVSIAAAVAVTTTGLVSLLGITAFTKRYGVLRQTSYDIDLFVSLLSVIFSFRDWKARLFACGASEERVVGTWKRRLMSNGTELSPSTTAVEYQT